MFLKSLTLRGFKTFADKTIIEFEPLGGITAIVGPNGCGKSNLVDSIRWVLGEQSLKDLRSTSLDEVIFAGSTARKPLSLAEVSIELDNSDSALKSEYSELSIKRRVFRSGESEFFINKNQCRLKDIRDLFLDTGLGKGSYALINQGRVDSILSDSPDERRAPFEEAAGISKYRARREAASRKLISTEQNILRINDLKRELSVQLKNLEEQATKAKSYKELKDKLRELEIGLAKRELKSLTGKRETLLEKVNSMKSRADEEVSEAKKIELRKDEIRANLKSIEAEVENIGVNIENTRFTIDEIKKALAIEQEREKNLVEKLSSAQTETGKLQENINLLKERYGIKKQELQVLSSSFDEMTRKLNEKEKELEAISQNLAEHDGEFEKTKALIFEKERNISQEKNKLIELAGNERFAREEIKRDLRSKSELETERGELDQRQKELQEKISLTTDELQKINGQLSALKSEQALLESELKGKKEKEEKLKAELHAKSSRLSLLLELETNFNESMRELLDKHGQEMLGLITQLYKTEEKHELAIRTALSGALHGIVTENEGGTKKLIEHLRTKELSRATFFPLDLVSLSGSEDISQFIDDPGIVGRAIDLIKFDAKYEKLFKTLLDGVVIVENLNKAFDLFKKIKNKAASCHFKLVTLSGDHILWTGEVSGGGGRRKTEDSVEIEKEILSLKNTVAELERQLKELSVAALEGKIVEIEASTDSLEGQANEKNISLATLGEQASSVGSKIKALSEEHELISQSLSARESELAQIEKERAEIISSISSLENENAVLKEKLEKDKAGLDEVFKDKDGLNLNLIEIKVSHAKTSSEVSRLEWEAASLDENVRKAMEELYEKSRDVIEEKLLKSRQDINNFITEDARLDQQRAALEQSLSDQKTKKVALSIELEEIEQKLKGGGEKERSLIDILRREEINLAKLESELSALEIKMKEEYALTIEEILSLPFEVDNMAQGKSDVLEIKTRIKELEPVNLLAIEEFEKCRDRLNFIETQSNDLAFARENLRSLIEELDKKAKEDFLYIINIVSENFSKVFASLFEGGEAKLMLVEGEDPLEAGIEILARPTGKKWLNLSLLSGGERALTAISILFALMKTKPSPFCFLDEVDAALDEANIHRFTKLLREFSRDSQIVVITHNKRTMAIVDSMYGITMEEAGTSKLISMKMTKVASQQVA